MIVWLDHKIFGNGYGLKSPHSDSNFYWLSGEFYFWIGGLGAQLQNFQWHHPKAGEERELIGRKFRPLHSRRRWGRVEAAWATHLPDNIDAANAELRRMKQELDEL